MCIQVEKGGTQATCGLIVNALSCAINTRNLVRLENGDSETTPLNELLGIINTSKFTSCPRLLGRVPFIWLLEISNAFKDDNLPIHAGIGPKIELL